MCIGFSRKKERKPFCEMLPLICIFSSSNISRQSQHINVHVISFCASCLYFSYLIIVFGQLSLYSMIYGAVCTTYDKH